MFVKIEQGQNQLVKLRIFELSLHRTPVSSPVYTSLFLEEMLPVVGNVGEHRPQTPHVGRGCDVTTFSENLGGQEADSANIRVSVSEMLGARSRSHVGEERRDVCG